MKETRKLSDLKQALLCSLALMVFSFFVQYDFPVRFVSFAALLFAAWIISRNLNAADDLKIITGSSVSLKKLIFFLAAGIVAGALLAMFYRDYLDLPLIPFSLQVFVLAGALIGSMEELVFRGFLQGYTQKIGGLFSILFGTISHTGYKCFLFLAPVISVQVNIGFLFVWTFGVGLVFGIARHFTKSIWMPLAAHAMFDIIAYAEFVQSPWWVW